MRNLFITLLARAEWRLGYTYWAVKAHILDTYHHYRAYVQVFIVRRLLNASRHLHRMADGVLATQPISQVVDDPEPDVEPDFFYDEVTQVVEEVLPAAVQDELVYLEGLNDARYEMWDAFIENGRWDATEVYDEEVPAFVNVEKLS